MMGHHLIEGEADTLLTWLSARGRASRATVWRACDLIQDRAGPGRSPDPGSMYRLVAALKRAGHVEERLGAVAVVPTTLCWTARPGRGIIIGARDASLRSALGDRLGPAFAVEPGGDGWPATWSLTGEREDVGAKLAGLDLGVTAEPGIALLDALPGLEEAIGRRPDAGRLARDGRGEVLADPLRLRWGPIAAGGVADGLIRTPQGNRRAWGLVRGGIVRPLDSPEWRAIGLWAELARRGLARLGHDEGSGRLRLGPGPLPPPLLVERPLIWAVGRPPGRDAGRCWVYEGIGGRRAEAVARVLGLGAEAIS